MRSVPIVLLLAACTCAGDDAPALARLTLPVASLGVEDKNDDPHDRVIIEVDALGQVYVAGKRATLGALVTHLMERKARHDQETKREGYEKLPHGGSASRLYALLRVHKDVPWQHVQWILTLLAEQRIYRIQLAVKRAADRSYRPEEAAALGAEWVDRAPPAKPRLGAKLDVLLPRDVSPIRGGKQPQELRIALHIMAREEVEALWGPELKPIAKPTTFRYGFTDRRSSRLADAAKWIRDAKRAARGIQPPAPVVGEIKAGYKVPFKYVVALLNQFRKQGIEQVEFWGAPVPAKELLKLPSLPYPVKNYPTPN